MSSEVYQIGKRDSQSSYARNETEFMCNFDYILTYNDSKDSDKILVYNKKGIAMEKCLRDQFLINLEKLGLTISRYPYKNGQEVQYKRFKQCSIRLSKICVENDIKKDDLEKLSNERKIFEEIKCRKFVHIKLSNKVALEWVEKLKLRLPINYEISEAIHKKIVERPRCDTNFGRNFDQNDGDDAQGPMA